MAAGKFITFEGGEGSGKSTQARLLAERLRATHIDVVLTREPGGSPFAERIREVLLDPATPPHPALAEALLFSAARADHLDKLIRPALKEGKWVISDRFSDSTRIYQGVAGAVPRDTIEALERLVVGTTAPDLTFIIDVPPTLGLARANKRREMQQAGRSADSFEARDLAYHERLRFGFLKLAKENPSRYVVIGGERHPSEVAEDVRQAIRARLLAKAK